MATQQISARALLDRSIQVSGLEIFEEWRWREAILHYLFGVWSDYSRVMYRPKICLGGVSLSLDTENEEYYAQGESPDREHPFFSSREERVLSVRCSQLEVEQGLIRFVKNNRIILLNITFRDSSRLCLWKKARRGEYGCWSNA